MAEKYSLTLLGTPTRSMIKATKWTNNRTVSQIWIQKTTTTKPN